MKTSPECWCPAARTLRWSAAKSLTSWPRSRSRPATAIGCCGPQQILIGQPDQVGPLLDGDGVVAAVSQPARDGDGVVAAVSQPARDGGGVHLVEEELHPDSSLRSFSQAANSRSAMWSLRAISASISSVNSA